MYQRLKTKILQSIGRNLFGVFCKRADFSRKISGPKEEKAEGRWGNLYKKELSGCESTPCMIKVLKSRSAR